MKNLLTRTLTGIIYVAIIIASILTHPLALAILTTLILFLAMKELWPMLSHSKPFFYWYFIISLFFLVAVNLIYFSSFLLVSILPLLMVFIIVQISAAYIKLAFVKEYLVNSSFALLYIALPLYLLNLIHYTSIHSEIPFTLAVFILIWTNDTFAYLTGLAFGRHKLIERISPKKTWEGFIGGFILTLIASYLLYHFYPSFGLITWLLFGFLVSTASVIGDFVESLLKRSANIKDSGNILPGHGGILDRIDSLLLVCPVLYIYISIVLK